MRNWTAQFASEIDGPDLENALVTWFTSKGCQAKRRGGENDGAKDIVVKRGTQTWYIQAKSSVQYAKEHLYRGSQFGTLIPVMVGCPEPDEDLDEVMDSLEYFVYYLAPYAESNRARVLLDEEVKIALELGARKLVPC